MRGRESPNGSEMNVGICQALHLWNQVPFRQKHSKKACSREAIAPKL